MAFESLLTHCWQLQATDVRQLVKPADILQIVLACHREVNHGGKNATSKKVPLPVVLL